MNRSVVGALFVMLIGSGCGVEGPNGSEPVDLHEMAGDRISVAGPHRGHMLIDDRFALEISIVETGVPPEFRAWATYDDVPVDPNEVDAQVVLERLGGTTDEINFFAQRDFLRGDAVVYEPHSFVVNVEATFQGLTHRWRYDSFEGRTRIAPELAEAAALGTERAGPTTMRDYVTVYGRIVSNPENVSHVAARFDGVIRSAHASIGDVVRRGQKLATIEANDSLNNYSVEAPISGTVIEKHANPGETTDDRTLFTIVDTSTVWAELAVFPSDRARVKVGSPVTLRTVIGGIESPGSIALLSPVAGENQSVTARVLLDNPEGVLAAGMYVAGEIEVAIYEVPLAVKRSGLQFFRDFTVVFAQFGDEYEVRMLDLGRQDDTWVEVLGGLSPGTEYVTTNSYVIKADIEKSGAAHDH